MSSSGSGFGLVTAHDVHGSLLFMKRVCQEKNYPGLQKPIRRLAFTKGGEEDRGRKSN